MRATHRRRAVAVVTAALLAGSVAAASAAETPRGPSGRPGIDVLSREDLGGTPSAGVLDEATAEYPDGTSDDHTLHGTITSVQVVETAGEDVLVTLASDLLFAVDSADLADAARQRVAELVAPVPAGAVVAVEGHTDTVASPEHNQDLSQRRAQAVAAAVAAARPDLPLEVRGFGETRPEVPEQGDDVAADRARNRRVELRYRSTGAGTTDTSTVRATPEPAQYVPGEPRLAELDPEAVVDEHVVEVPGGGGARVRVGVEQIEVRGPVARVRLHLTALDALGDDDWYSAHELTGGGELYTQVHDPVNLTTYRPANYAGLVWETDSVLTRVRLGETLRYETYVARPVDDVDTLDVSLVPQWPRFEGVPVVWDR